MRKLLIITLISASTLIGGCSLFSVHKIPIQQGNSLDPEKAAQLEVGMNRKQVLFLLGNPLIADSFHPDRWDYVFYLKKPDLPAEKRHLTVYFEDDRVIRIDEPIAPVVTAPEATETDN